MSSEAIASREETLGAVEVEGTDGARRRLHELWAEKPAVVVFVRHFG